MLSSKGFKINLEKKTLSNTNYRKVLSTTKQQQLVVMCIPVNGGIHQETHPSTTQFINVLKGCGLITIGGKKYKVSDGDAVVIPPGAVHKVQNTGKTALQLYTIYSPPEHPIGTVQKVDVSE
jgi:mannose-6-phosphate isomerase-like protein (cupin superfamily)